MKYGLFIIFLLYVISNTYASTDCLQRPSCEELGYDHSVEECAGRDILPCPFDIKNTETVYCGDTLCDRLVAEQGFVKVKKKMTLTEFYALFKTGVKICLAEDITFNDNVYIQNTNNVVINGGGGHIWTTKAISLGWNNVTLEDLKLVKLDDNSKFITSVVDGPTMTLRNVEIIQDGAKGFAQGISFTGKGIFENIVINMDGSKADELVGIQAGGVMTAKNISLNLKGSDKTSVVGVRSLNKSSSLENAEMEATGEKTYFAVGEISGVSTSPVGGEMLRTTSLFDGEANTKAIVDQIGQSGLAAYAATQFYVGDKDGDFGQGKWYLPAIGQMMDFYGFDNLKVTKGDSTGNTGSHISAIRNALATLSEKGAEAADITSGNVFYASSSEYIKAYVWCLSFQDGYRPYQYRAYDSVLVRVVLTLKDFVTDALSAPQIGDVMYEDKSFGTAEDYNGAKIPVGVVAALSENGRDVTLINLKNLTFSVLNSVGNFDPDNPYGGTYSRTWWSVSDKLATDITGVENFPEAKFVTTINPTMPVSTAKKIP